MQYMGGKQLISTRISEIINHEISGMGGETFVSLFCGACSIESKIKADTKILNDKHEYLIEMFRRYKMVMNCLTRLQKNNTNTLETT